MVIVVTSCTVTLAVKCIDRYKTTNRESCSVRIFSLLCKVQFKLHSSKTTGRSGLTYALHIKPSCNEERRLGDQRGSDTLVVSFYTRQTLDSQLHIACRYIDFKALMLLLHLKLSLSLWLAITIIRSTCVNTPHRLYYAKHASHSDTSEYYLSSGKL